jgi:hypothetical protein
MKLARLYIFLNFFLPILAFGGTINGTGQNKSPSTDVQNEKVSPPVNSYGNAEGKVQTPYGKPVSNQNVYLLQISGGAYSVFESTSTDSDGRWIIKNVPPGFYSSWVSDDPPNLTIGVGAKREIISGKTTNFGTHSKFIKDDSTPRDIAKRDATPYKTGSSELLTNGFYACQKDNEGWTYLRFYADGTVRTFSNDMQPDKPTRSDKEWLKEYPYVGDWGQFTVNGSNILIVISPKSNVKISDKWICTIIQKGKKLSFSREKRNEWNIGSISTDKETGTLTFYNDSNWNE